MAEIFVPIALHLKGESPGKAALRVLQAANELGLEGFKIVRMAEHYTLGDKVMDVVIDRAGETLVLNEAGDELVRYGLGVPIRWPPACEWCAKGWARTADPRFHYNPDGGPNAEDRQKLCAWPYTRGCEISPDGEAITCLTCGKTSHNKNDVENLYCRNCHKFHAERVSEPSASPTSSSPSS